MAVAIAAKHLTNRVDDCVERICQKGCRRVGKDILAIESGSTPPELRHLTPDERIQVLMELKSVMAVYGGACPMEAKAGG